MEEVQQHGGFKLVNGHTHHDLNWLKSIGKFPIHHKEHNPYIEKFWEWWPSLYASLNTFRITGGEPLLSNNTWKIFEYIKENPRPEIKLHLNSNFGIPAKLVDKLVENVNAIEGKCGEVVIFTSAESTGKHAEYSRFGMDWNLFESNVHNYLSNTKNTLHFMTTVDIFASASFDEFVRFVCSLRKTYDTERSRSRVGFNVNYLRWPQHQQITLLDKEQKDIFAAKMKALVEELTVGGFDVNGNLYIEEVDQINRLVEWMYSQEAREEELTNFRNVFNEMDKRRGTNMLETFPHLKTVFG
jgi:organic radical activating enzyme